MRIFHQWILAIALYFALVLDGVISMVLQRWLPPCSSLLLPTAVILIALFDDMNNKEIYLALGAGVIADIYFLGFLGVYTVSLPLLTWLCQKFARFLPETFWARLVIVILGTLLLQIYSFAILTIIGLTNVGLIALLKNLGTSLVLTIIWTIATYGLWGRLAESYPFLVDLDAYRQ